MRFTLLKNDLIVFILSFSVHCSSCFNSFRFKRRRQSFHAHVNSTEEANLGMQRASKVQPFKSVHKEITDPSDDFNDSETFCSFLRIQEVVLFFVKKIATKIKVSFYNFQELLINSPNNPS